MRTRFTYISYVILISASLYVGASSCSKKDKGLPSLRETYNQTDKNPFGAYVAKKLTEQIFSSNSIRVKKESFDKTWNNISYYDTSSLYICITPKLLLFEEEADAMLNYVAAGNDLFIASNYFDEDFLKRIEVGQREDNFENLFMPDSFRITDTKSVRPSNNSYSYYYKKFNDSFNKMDSVFAKVLGVNEPGNPNFIVFFHGKGKLFLHCDPRAFSNYFLLKKENSRYLEKVYAYTQIRPTHVYWDDFYRKRNYKSGKEFSSLSEIFKYPPLKTAFFLLLGLLLAYIIFGGKRRQRIIPITKPNENTTVTFTETIGRLYLQNKDNKNIADKMIMYFNEHIRNKYYLHTHSQQDDFIKTLSRKTGIEQPLIETLYRTIHHAQQNYQITDFELLTLNEQIQKFYQNTK